MPLMCLFAAQPNKRNKSPARTSTTLFFCQSQDNMRTTGAERGAFHSFVMNLCLEECSCSTYCEPNISFGMFLQVAKTPSQEG